MLQDTPSWRGEKRTDRDDPREEPITRYSSTREAAAYESRDRKIFGVLHRPVAPELRACPALAMYHGFMAAKHQLPHRLFVQLAEALAQIGVVSLRIDLPGRGDSEGDSIDISVEDDLAAAQQALDFLATRPEVDRARLGVVGISWGGLLAATLAGRDPRVVATVLWSSVPSEAIDWRPTFQDVDGRRVSEFVGNLVGEQFYAGLHQLSPLADLARARGPVLLVYGTADDEVDAGAIEHARERLSAAGVPADVAPIANADHVFFAPAWQRQVIATSIAWIERILLPSQR